MDQYVPEFSAKDVDGQQLLQLDGKALKVRTPPAGARLRADPVLSSGSGRPQRVGPRRSEATHQRRAQRRGEAAEGCGEDGEDGEAEKKKAGAVQQLSSAAGGRQRAGTSPQPVGS